MVRVVGLVPPQRVLKVSNVVPSLFPLSGFPGAPVGPPGAALVKTRVTRLLVSRRGAPCGAIGVVGVALLPASSLQLSRSRRDRLISNRPSLVARPIDPLTTCRTVPIRWAVSLLVIPVALPSVPPRVVVELLVVRTVAQSVISRIPR